MARVAAMIGDPARSRLLAYLLSGEFASAGELARAGGVTAATASAHLAKLQDTGLTVCEARGRHRYFRLADAEVAHALSALALVAERGAHAQAWMAPQRQRLRQARCCYGHIGGQLGVALFGCLQQQGRMAQDGSGWRLTESGTAWLRGLDFSAVPAVGQQRFAYGCLDWSERRDHLAGSLGRQLLNHFVDQGWLRRSSAGDRALTPTPRGRQHLLPYLGLR
ncbi:MAG TPA: helix-turn-helix transcriptional regulator [Rubrivivax sp.]|nr:helix-turn-helix transcriptional regulator [Rubrivivax sp.]